METLLLRAAFARLAGVPTGDMTSMNGFAAWADSVVQNPMPVRYKLKPFAGFAATIAEAAAMIYNGSVRAEGRHRETFQRTLPCACSDTLPHTFVIVVLAGHTKRTTCHQCRGRGSMCGGVLLGWHEHERRCAHHLILAHVC